MLLFDELLPLIGSKASLSYLVLEPRQSAIFNFRQKGLLDASVSILNISRFSFYIEVRNDFFNELYHEWETLYFQGFIGLDFVVDVDIHLAVLTPRHYVPLNLQALVGFLQRKHNALHVHEIGYH